MPEQKCKWTTEPPKHVPYPHPTSHDCPESTLKGDNQCILHYGKTKDLNSFKQKVKERIDTKANVIDLRGLYFPQDFDEQYFKEQEFTKPVFFNGATFCGKVNFSGATFLKGADFYRTRFSAETSFDKTVFKGFKTNFREAKFEGDISFFDTQFRSEEVSFTDTEFIKKVKFDNPYFYGRAYFIKTKFEERCEFGWGEFSRTKPPIFKETDLRNCSFLHSNIDKVDFGYCEFAKEEEDWPFCIFSRPRKNVLRDELEADGSVRHSERSEESRPFASSFVTLRTSAQGDRNKKLREEKYEPVRRLYLELKRNFEDKKDWNTAGDFHYGEMECRRKMKGWLGRNVFSLEAVYYWASGYGERPWRALLCILFFIFLFFPWVYSKLDTLPRQGYEYYFWELSVKASFLQRIGEEGNDPLGLCSKFFYLLQSALCPMLIALFILALRRKVKR